jgi:hypothetical protein
MEENQEALEVYDLCKNQLILAPMGGAIGLRIEGIKAAMEILGVQNQVECLEKVLIFSQELFKK